MAKSSAIALRSAQHKPAKGKKKLIEISFEPAKGGVISKTRHRTEGDEYGPSDTETAVHPTADHAAAHLVATMASCFEGAGSGNKPADGHSKK